MWKAYVYIILFLIFAGSAVLIGWGLTVSDQFKHIDSDSNEKKITWWKVCVVAACCALVFTLFVALLYKIFFNQSMFGNSHNVWVNDWSPSTVYTQYGHLQQNVEYSGIPEPGMYVTGLL